MAMHLDRSSPLRPVPLALLLGSLLLACQSVKPRKTGHLTTYSNLREVSGRVWTCEDPGVARGIYQRFVLEPFAIHLEPDSGTKLTRRELDELREYFHAEAIAAVAPRFRLATQPGPGVAIVRTALTDVKESKPLLDLLPPARLTGVGFGGAASEGEVIDSLTGRQVSAILWGHEGKLLSTSGLTRMSDIERAIDAFAKELPARLERLAARARRARSSAPGAPAGR
jgi:hypothetical protein